MDGWMNVSVRGVVVVFVADGVGVACVLNIKYVTVFV